MYSKSVVQEGLVQLGNYMTTLGEKTGWLVIFDRGNKRSWDKKIFWKTEISGGKVINIGGC